LKILCIHPPHFDHSFATVSEGLQEIRNKEGNLEVKWVENSNYADPDHILSENEAIDYGDEADLIIVTSNNDVNHRIHEQVGEYNKTVYIDGEDGFNYRETPARFAVYFKREMRVETDHHLANVEPLPFAAEKRYFHWTEGTEKELDVSCTFGPSDGSKPWRPKIEDSLRRANFERSYVGQVSPSMWEREGKTEGSDAYYGTIARSKVSVSARGGQGASICGRQFEILANFSCLVDQRIYVVFDYPLINGVHYVAYEDENDVSEAIKWCLKDDKWLEIASNSYEYVKKYHTSEARAKYFLAVCQKRIGGIYENEESITEG